MSRPSTREDNHGEPSSPSPPPHRSPSPRRRQSSRSPSRSHSPSPTPSTSSHRSSSPSRRRSRSRSLTPSSQTIKITGLTKLIAQWHLEEIFSAYGPIEDVYLATFTQSGEPRGHAWVMYSRTSSAERAIECMDKGQIDGAIVAVRYDRMPSVNGRNGGIAPSSYGDDRRRGYDYSYDQYGPPRAHIDYRVPRSHRRSRSPSPRRLHKQRSISRSLSPPPHRDEYRRRPYDADTRMHTSRSRSRSRTRSRSRGTTLSPVNTRRARG